jgi:hypothetical protein
MPAPKPVTPHNVLIFSKTTAKLNSAERSNSGGQDQGAVILQFF